MALTDDGTAGLPLDGKVALVTGGNGGIGLGIAHALASAGASIAIWGTDAAKNERAAGGLAAHDREVATFACDVTDEASVESAFSATVEQLGRVDACFANAGVGGGGIAFQDIEFGEWRRIVSVNLDGTFLTFRAAVRHMIERGEGGSLVATSSLTAIEGAPRSEHYAASKAGVVALVKSLAVELGRHRIRVNALMPGWIETEMSSPLLGSDAARERILPRVPLRRWGTPADIGPAAVYLAGTASDYHTGDVLVIDGAYRLF
jgi:hypothetical protein